MPILYFLAFVIFAVPASIVLWLVAGLLTRGRPRATLATRAALAVVPLVGMYFAALIWLWGGWLSLRGLDPGIYDTFQVPLGHGYYAVSTDSSSPHGVLEGPGVQDRREVRRAGCAGTRVVVELEGPGKPPYVLISGGSPGFRTFGSEAALRSAGGDRILWGTDNTPPPACRPRETSLDRVLLGVLLAPPLAWLVGTPFLAWAVRRGKVREISARERRLTAALLALTLGAFGVHKWYLGADRPASLMLSIGAGGALLGMVLVLPVLGTLAMALVGVVEAGLYLRRGDAAFALPGPPGKRPWF